MNKSKESLEIPANTFCSHCPRSEICSQFEETIEQASRLASDPSDLNQVLLQLNALGYEYPVGQRSCKLVWMEYEELLKVIDQVDQLKKSS